MTNRKHIKGFSRKADLSGKRLFIVGAGIFQVPAIMKAREMGIITITADKDTDAPGFRYADHSEVVSTHDADALLLVARKYKIDGIMTLSTEVAVVPTAYVAEKLRLPGLSPDVARTATNKFLMKKVFADHRIPIAAFRLAKSPADIKTICSDLAFPLMVKPSSSYASKGIFKVHNRKELSAVLPLAQKESQDGTVIVEEFLQGLEVGGESFSLQGKTDMIYITNKKITRPPRYIPLGHTVPSVLPADIQAKIKEVVQRGVAALSIHEGPVNFDIMVTESGPKILEMGARLGGNCLPSMITIHSGIDTIRATIELALGLKPCLEKKQAIPAGVRILTSETTGVIRNITGIEELKNKRDIVDLQVLYGSGDRVRKIESGADKLGYVIVTGRTVEDVTRKLDRYSKKIKISFSTAPYKGG
ncbi:MAG: ATP-grasp domain-containing protein [Nitrospirota bacterium]